MADHVRKQLRDSIKTALETATGLSVHTNRVEDLVGIDLPAIVVLTDTETAERLDKSGALHRQITAAIVLIVDGASVTLDEELDAFSVSIETALGGDPPSPAYQIDLLSTELDLQSDEDGDRWFGYLVLEYTANVFTTKADPTAAIA
jgi:hypothetical protein